MASKESGNPSRFHSNEVTRMGEGERRGPGPRRDLAGPVEDIETEGERRLQELLHKQLSTNVSRQQIARGRDFVGGTPFKAATDDLSGVTSLSQFKTLGEKDAYIEELKQCGLTEEEVNLKLESDQVTHRQKDRKRRYGSDTSFYSEKLEAIEEKIRRRDANLSRPDTFSDQKVLSRHEMDLERALVKDDVASRNLSTALTTQTKHKNHPHPDDPMNNLPEILASITAQGKRGGQREHSSTINEETECSFPKERQFYEQEECYSEPNRNSDKTQKQLDMKERDTTDTGDSSVLIDKASNHDITGSLCSNGSNETAFNSAHVTETKGDNSANKESMGDNSGIGDRHGHIEWVEEEYIVKNRLSLEEIKQIPRFEKYSPGSKSKVLYIKNLSNKVTEDDLVALFIRFQNDNEEKLHFRLLTGRMKGQAFVTFPSGEKAMSAMELVHGLNYKGKPIIIQYGRGTT